MATTNNPKNPNNNPHGLGDQVQITLQIEAWIERISDDMTHAKPGDPQWDYLDGKIDALQDVLNLLKKGD